MILKIKNSKYKNTVVKHVLNMASENDRKFVLHLN